MAVRISDKLSGTERAVTLAPSLNRNPVLSTEQRPFMTHKSADSAWQPLGDLAKRIVEDSARRMANPPQKPEAAE